MEANKTIKKIKKNAKMIEAAAIHYKQNKLTYIAYLSIFFIAFFSSILNLKIFRKVILNDLIRFITSLSIALVSVLLYDKDKKVINTGDYFYNYKNNHSYYYFYNNMKV